jgi:hypothetical protein
MYAVKYVEYWIKGIFDPIILRMQNLNLAWIWTSIVNMSTEKLVVSYRKWSVNIILDFNTTEKIRTRKTKIIFTTAFQTEEIQLWYEEGSNMVIIGNNFTDG